jgi:hypothetical protein
MMVTSIGVVAMDADHRLLDFTIMQKEHCGTAPPMINRMDLKPHRRRASAVMAHALTDRFTPSTTSGWIIQDRNREPGLSVKTFRTT